MASDASAIRRKGGDRTRPAAPATWDLRAIFRNPAQLLGRIAARTGSRSGRRGVIAHDSGGTTLATLRYELAARVPAPRLERLVRELPPGRRTVRVHGGTKARETSVARIGVDGSRQSSTRSRRTDSEGCAMGLLCRLLSPQFTRLL